MELGEPQQFHGRNQPVLGEVFPLTPGSPLDISIEVASDLVSPLQRLGAVRLVSCNPMVPRIDWDTRQIIIIHKPEIRP